MRRRKPRSSKNETKEEASKPLPRTIRVEISGDYRNRVVIEGAPEGVKDIVETVMTANQPFWQKHFGALAGLVLLAAAVILAFTFQNPSPLQEQVILILVSLGGGAFSLEFAERGMRLNLKLGAKLVVFATGAAAVFIILFFFTPAGLHQR